MFAEIDWSASYRSEHFKNLVTKPWQITQQNLHIVQMSPPFKSTTSGEKSRQNACLLWSFDLIYYCEWNPQNWQNLNPAVLQSLARFFFFSLLSSLPRHCTNLERKKKTQTVDQISAMNFEINLCVLSMRDDSLGTPFDASHESRLLQIYAAHWQILSEIVRK